ncbi:MAG: YhcH/YjgK/YiaL family protein [Rikenellaceae bacterium]
MILDRFENASLYYGLTPSMERAFEIIAQTDWASLPAGVTELEGKEIFVNIMEVDLKQPQDAKLEIHNRYADIQILLDGDEEGFGWSARSDIKEAIGEFDEQKDVQFFNDKHQTIYYIRKGQFTILMPEDAHAPMIGKSAVRKAIVKVLL